MILGDARKHVKPVPVFFVSLEQSRVELAERLLVAQARVDSHKLRKGLLNNEDMQQLIEAGDKLRSAKLFIDDTPGKACCASPPTPAGSRSGTTSAWSSSTTCSSSSRKTAATAGRSRSRRSRAG